MIGVGINENVKLENAVLNEKGTLEIFFAEDGTAKVNTADLLNQTAGVTGANDTRILLYVPNTEYNGEKREIKDIAIAIGGFRDQLEHILQGYLPSAEATLNPYEGIDISDPTAFQESLKNQSTIDRIYKNLATQFIEKLSNMRDALSTKLFRLKLIRQSAAKHYGTLPSRFISNNPFWEPMEIPKDRSRVKFTKYELDKGLDNGNPVKKDEETSVNTGSTQQNTGNVLSSILGTR